jgi:SAM-dependent methyltransferase
LEPYTRAYYRSLREGARQSAQVLVPMILRYVPAKSVIDVGCGQGTWLRVFQENGMEDIWGVDGDHVERDELEIPAERFQAADLTHPITLKRRFDLVISLEVAEHLAVECADEFVESLTRLSPAVLFSAAAPYQGGTCHVNEQWPSYWAARFRERGYEPVDCLRRRVWQDERVQWWYAQNILFYIDRDYLEQNPLLNGEYKFGGGTALSLVHPKRFLEWVEWGMSQLAERADQHTGAAAAREHPHDA